MDATDRRLIDLLKADSRRPLKNLAAAVSLAPSSVRERIQRLLVRGDILRFTIETRAAPDCGAILLVRLKTTPDPEMVAIITRRSDVVRCLSLSGPNDLLVEIGGMSVAEINRARDEIASLPGVSDLETSFILKRDKAPIGLETP